MKILAASMSLGRVAPRHNLNNNYRMTLNNVNQKLTKDNIVYIDNLKGRTIEEYTNDVMQQFIDEYNAKQKRKDRKINMSYTEWHQQDKIMMQGVKEGEKPEWMHEFVLCYGNNEDYWHEYFNPKTPQSRKDEMYNEADTFYQKAIKEFQKKYPHAHIIYAVLHADENNGSIHVHLCVQFRGSEYTRGLRERISVSRGLEQDGFEHFFSESLAKENGGYQMERLFKDFRHNVMNKQLEELGFAIKEEEHGKKHIPSNAYTELMTKATETVTRAEQEAEQIMSKAEQEAAEKVTEAKTKADSITYFIDKVKEIEEKEKKVLKDGERSKYHDLVKTTYRDTTFSKPRQVAIQDLIVYESQEAVKDISHAKEDAKRVSEEIMKVVDDTINSIELSRKVEDEREIERLKEQLKEKDKIIEKQQEKISTLEQAVDYLKEFIQSLNVIQKWNQFWERKKQEREWARTKTQEQEVEYEY